MKLAHPRRRREALAVTVAVIAAIAQLVAMAIFAGLPLGITDMAALPLAIVLAVVGGGMSALAKT